ncbi:MAG: DsbA family protein [Sphingobium sp.]|jgi:protein-disulfide isomerase|nr:DsbA family protein [Sphingobium sp.]MCP5399526.1 DsbA family protein [Sphingomonas sp.]
MQLLIGGLVALSAAGATAVAVQSSTDTVSPANRAQIEQIVRDYILEHPEILPQAMARLKEKQVSAVIQEKRSSIETPYHGAWEGAENGDVVLTEFFDYACGYCRASMPDIIKLLGEDKKLKVVYRELPILSEESGQAARVSLLAAKNGKYPVFHKALYDEGTVSRNTILAAAAKTGLDRKDVLAAMTDESYTSEIENNIRLAQALGASGTPTFVVGDQVLNGAVGYDALKEAIAKARADK